MSRMSILNDIEELVDSSLITEGQARKIRDHYRDKEDLSRSKLFTVFGLLGAILVGLGLILILAHNWDGFSRTVKTILAIVPLVTGQIICAYTLVKKQDRVSWRESSATFLFFAVGSSISLVSQIYNIPGNLSSFILTWLLLCLPSIYLMKSSIVSLFSLIGITYYACETGYWTFPPTNFYVYGLFLLAILPHYYQLYKVKSQSNFMIFHNWIIPLSITISLGSLSLFHSKFMFIAYLSLLAGFYLLGNRTFFSQQKLRNNAYGIIGSLGIVIVLLILSFDWFWIDLMRHSYDYKRVIVSPEFRACLLISLLPSLLLYFQQKGKKFSNINPISLVFILFPILFVIGQFSLVAVLLINLYIFVIGTFTIREGAKKNHLGILNYGLIIIMALVTCRFFDENISFVIRGILFVSVGIGFFVANYVMLKKRKNEKNI